MGEYTFWDEMWNTSGSTSEKNIEVDEHHQLDQSLNKIVEDCDDDFLRSINLTEEQISKLREKWKTN